LADQKTLKKFLERRHPDYKRMAGHWRFLEATYEGGRDWFECGNIFRYIKEGDKEYKERVERAYRFNHTREVTDLVQKYIFKSPIIRDDTDAPLEIKTFWENATLSGLDVNQFMKLVSTESSKLGRCYVVVDTTMPAVETTGAPISKAQARAIKARAYAYIVSPLDVLDIGFDEQGDMTWVLIRERVRDDADPINSTGACYEQFRLWTKTYHQLFTVELRKNDIFVVPGPQVPHAVGTVPVFAVDHVIGDNKYSAPALINDIAYLDRAAANYLSNLDAIIQDQTFSQLVMPAQGLMPGEDKYNALIEMGTKRIFAYDGEGGAKPEYISPDVKQAQLIITVINKIITEIYHTIGMAGERTKTDNGMGIDNSSGVAKAYDFERMNSLLTSKADSLENAENKLINLVMAWNAKKAPEKELVKYPDTFDVRSLFDEFTIAERLALVDAPDTLRQEQMKQVIEKLFPRLAEDLRKKMETDLKSWPPKLEDLATTVAGGSKQPTIPAKGPKPAASKRQGQVTKTTGQ
jgi:hypothetical protein